MLKFLVLDRNDYAYLRAEVYTVRELVEEVRNEWGCDDTIDAHERLEEYCDLFLLNEKTGNYEPVTFIPPKGEYTVIPKSK